MVSNISRISVPYFTLDTVLAPDNYVVMSENGHVCDKYRGQASSPAIDMVRRLSPPKATVSSRI